MVIFSGGVEYAKVDEVGHLAQWTACMREGINEEGRGCLFRLGLHFKEYFHSFINRLKSSSEQEVVKEGVSYCIIIQESKQIGSASECCIPKVMKLSKDSAYDKT